MKARPVLRQQQKTATEHESTANVVNTLKQIITQVHTDHNTNQTTHLYHECINVIEHTGNTR